MPNVRGKGILLIGDSLSASSSAPGGVLARELRGAGAAVDVNAKVGRSAYTFMQKEGGQGQIDAVPYRPEIAIVMLGTNDTGYAAGTTKTAMLMLKNALEAKGAQVYAIGPPLFAGSASTASGRTATVDAMRSVFGSKFIDMGPATADLVTNNRTSDLIHFTPAGGEIAGVRLAKSFQGAGAVSPLVIGAAALLALVVWLRR